MNLFRLVDGAIEPVTRLRGGVRRAGLAVRVRRPTTSSPTARSSPSPARRPRPAGRIVGPMASSHADRPAVHRDGQPRRSTATPSSLRAAGPAEPAAVVELDLRRHVDGPAPGDAVRARSRGRRRSPEHIEFPTTGGRHGLRQLLLAPTNRSFRGSRRRAAAAHRDEPRRPDGRGVLRLRDGHAAVHQPRLRGARRRLRRLAPATARRTASASSGQWGIVDVDDCVARRALPRRAGPRRRQAPGDPRRQRQRVHDPRRAGVHRRVRCRLHVLRHRRPAGVREGHPQVRVALPREPRRAVAGGEAAYLDRSPSLHAEQITVAGARPAGRRGQDRPASPRPSGSSTRCSSAASRTPTCSTRARTTASAATTRSSARSGPSCRFYAQVFGFEPADDIEPLEIQFLEEARGAA